MRFGYDPDRDILKGIPLDVPAGSTVAVVGPSGAGKSSLLGILGMLDGAWAGEYHLLDQPVQRVMGGEPQG